MTFACVAGLMSALLPVLPPPTPKGAIDAVPVTVNAESGCI